MGLTVRTNLFLTATVSLLILICVCSGMPRTEGDIQTSDDVVNMEVVNDNNPALQDEKEDDVGENHDELTNQNTASFTDESEEPIAASTEDEQPANKDSPNNNNMNRPDETDWGLGINSKGESSDLVEEIPGFGRLDPELDQGAPPVPDPSLSNQPEDWSTSEADQHDGSQYGVPNPEEIMHGDDVHGQQMDSTHQHDGDESCPECIEKQLKSQKENEEQRARAEQQEMDDVMPKVLELQGNVKDGRARAAAEFLKTQQFGPGDVEEILHQGHQVHHDEKRGPIQAGDMGGFAGSQDPGTEKNNDKLPLTLDPEELMHGGQGGAHNHNPHLEQEVVSQSVPRVDTPEEIMHKNEEGNWGHDHEGKVKSVEHEKPIGLNIEAVVHGSDHVHDNNPDAGPGKKITYQDIQELGLKEETLKGIDLTNLMAADKKEYEDWRKDGQLSEEVHIEDESSFWARVNKFRQDYLSDLSNRVRDIPTPDLDTAEWEAPAEGYDKDGDNVHPGETIVEHEMEMWGSTAAKKGNRQPLDAKLKQRRMHLERQNGNGEEEREGL